MRLNTKSKAYKALTPQERAAITYFINAMTGSIANSIIHINKRHKGHMISSITETIKVYGSAPFVGIKSRVLEATTFVSQGNKATTLPYIPTMADAQLELDNTHSRRRA